ncbi:MAG: class I SAM-dependent methyltransferase [Burkholderiales bacterium]|nr:class I SAM-dependent methyltransferase [Burkholderiales bacterium]
MSARRCAHSKEHVLSESAQITWTEGDASWSVRWHSESGTAAPRRVAIVDDSTNADAAYRLACEGTALLYRGDFQNARQLLQALARRLDRKPRKAALTPAENFHLHRQAQSQRARVLGMVLLPFDADNSVPLRRAPDVREACTEAWGPAEAPYVASLRELLGAIGAYEWRKKGVEVQALGARIHPHYGVFAPVRSEYVDLLAQTPLPDAIREHPAQAVAFDIGTGTGVLAAVLARRGIGRIVATDQDPRALICARDNIERLALSDRIDVIEADLFPEGRAPLIVCNPPWVPARAVSPLEHAVYDPDGKMLHGFVAGLAAHLEPAGEGWLLLSDLAEHLGLRTREALLAAFDAAGLAVIEKRDIRPRHPKAADTTDPLHAARAAEVTSLWRLGRKP